MIFLQSGAESVGDMAISSMDGDALEPGRRTERRGQCVERARRLGPNSIQATIVIIADIGCALGI